MADTPETVRLPAPVTAAPLDTLLRQRRSVRAFSDAALDLQGIGRLLWAAQGITHPEGLRTAPSAGALYPLELYLVAGDVQGLDAGVYHYRPAGHELIRLWPGDPRAALARAALGQDWVGTAPAVAVFAAAYARTTRKYGERGVRYVHVEAGHAAQNLFLQAGALGLATVVVGAFDDAAVSRVLRLPGDVRPLLLMPVGHARRS